MNKLLKALGFADCYMCKQRVQISSTIIENFCGPENTMHKEYICRKCNNSLMSDLDSNLITPEEIEEA